MGLTSLEECLGNIAGQIQHKTCKGAGRKNWLPSINILQAWVFQKVDNAFSEINHYPVNGVVCFVNNYPLCSNLSSG